MRLRNIFSLAITLLLCCVTVLGFAAPKSEWQKAKGSYVWTQSSQFNNGILNILPLEDDIYLYEFKVLRGSESEDSAEEFQTAGTFLLEDNGDGVADMSYGDELVQLRFSLHDSVITATQDGALPLDIQGDYKHNEDSFEVSENAAVALIESLPSAVTSLTAANRPYRLVYADETVDGWFYQVTAIFEPTNDVIARYLVAADLSAVYRNDEGVEEPGLIYGSPENMLAATRAPLVEVEETEAPTVESGELEGDTEEKEQTAEAAAQVSALVTVAVEEESLRVGESTEIKAQLPGNVGYTVADLVSENTDVVKVEGNTLVGVAPGTASVKGNLHLEKGKKPFEVSVTVYEPRLENTSMPTHIAIGDKLPLEAFITGEEGFVDAEWSVSDEKIAVLEDGKLVGKADGLVIVTAKYGEMTSSWYVAVGKAELPLGAEDGEDEDDGLSWLTIIGGIVVVGGGALWFFRRKK